MHMDPIHLIIVGLLVLVIVILLAMARRHTTEKLGGGGFSTLTGLDWYDSHRTRCDERGCYVEGPVLF